MDERFIGQVVRGKGLRGSNVLGRQARMVRYDCFGRHASPKLAQNDLDGHTRSGCCNALAPMHVARQKCRVSSA